MQASSQTQPTTNITGQYTAGIWLIRLTYAALLASGALEVFTALSKGDFTTILISAMPRLIAAFVIIYAEQLVKQGQPTSAAFVTITSAITAMVIMGLMDTLRIGWLVGVVVGLLLSFISIQLMPPRWAGRGIFIAFSGGSLIAMTDYLDRSVHYNPNFSDPQISLLLVLSLVLGFILFSRFANYPITAKLVLAIASISTFTLNAVCVLISSNLSRTTGIAPETIQSVNLNLLLSSQLGIFFSAIMALQLAHFITLPLLETVELVERIAIDGDLSKRGKIIFKDEVGRMAGSINQLLDKLDEIARDANRMSQGELTVSFVPRSDQDVLGNSFVKMVSSLRNLVTMLRESAVKLSSASGQLSSKTSFVASAAEEMSANTMSVAAGMQLTDANLHNVASAVEEMTATIGEIARNSEKAHVTTEEAARQVDQFSNTMKILGGSARDIGKVTETITKISSQTNLLALNATIEAARAGATGKGFAVVANEIKALAIQTASATSEIKEKISTIQGSIGSAVTEIDQIVAVIRDVNNIVVSIAAAIQEQSTVTQDIAGHIAQASNGVRDANSRVSNSADVATSIASHISELSGGTGSTVSARALTQLADQINQVVAQFQV